VREKRESTGDNQSGATSFVSKKKSKKKDKARLFLRGVVNSMCVVATFISPWLVCPFIHRPSSIQGGKDFYFKGLGGLSKSAAASSSSSSFAKEQNGQLRRGQREKKLGGTTKTTTTTTVKT
jgi:hypothetical protein